MRLKRPNGPARLMRQMIHVNSLDVLELDMGTYVSWVSQDGSGELIWASWVEGVELDKLGWIRWVGQGGSGKVGRASWVG